MFNIILFIVLCTEVFLFTAFDKRAYGNVFSPVVILSYPALIIIALAMFIAPLFGFRPLSSNLLLLFITGTFIFWLGSLFWSVVMPLAAVNKMIRPFQKPGAIVHPPFRKIVLVLAWIVIGYMMFSFVTVYRSFGSASALGSDEFAYAYGGSGWAGHILGLSVPLLIYFIGIVRRRDILVIVTIFFLVLTSLVYGVKTWLYLPLIGGVIMRFYKVSVEGYNCPFIGYCGHAALRYHLCLLLIKERQQSCR
jgi:hypothetical protein